MDKTSCILQTCTAQLGHRTVTVEHYSPPPGQDGGERIRGLEYDLYDIFVQYAGKGGRPWTQSTHGSP